VNYPKYLQTGQRVTLKVTVDEAGTTPRFDSIFAYIAACSESTLELVFSEPHGNHADYPFHRQQKIELMSDHLGMGISARASVVERRGGDRLIIDLSGDLNYFNRRHNARIETDLWIGLEESHVSISIIRERWEQAIRQARKKGGEPQFATFSRKRVSLSSSGLGLQYPKPVQPGTYFIVHLALDDNREMICIAGEVVRSEPGEENSFFLGIHFDCIEEDARQRIEQFVKQLCRAE
jgi:c-di-GMP-binding flagellar brake protein YcgR